jgi:hypothetical protein
MDSATLANRSHSVGLAVGVAITFGSFHQTRYEPKKKSGLW